MKEDTRPLMVTIQCFTYNQEAYIRECLEGFVMQKTDFRFEAIVHDDASTDSTAKIIREYEEKYPDIIKPIYETENQYSKHDGSLDSIMDEHTHGKYVAFCEGDDFWIDPLKLQKQFDFMESHPKHSLCFCAYKELFPSGETKEVLRYNKGMEICPISDIIKNGGGYMMTNAMFYRKDMYVPYTTWAIDCPVGDAPIMLTLAHLGLVGFISDVMCVYRVSAIGSWSQRMKSDINKRRKHFKAINLMWKQFDKWTCRTYHKEIRSKIIDNWVSHYKNEILSLFSKR